MRPRTSARMHEASPCTVSGAGRTCLNRMGGCPHRPFWQCVSTTRKKLNEHILTLHHSTPKVYPLTLTSGFSKLVSHPNELRNSTALDTLIEQVEWSFRSFIMENQPGNGPVEQLMDGSLSTSCPEGQLALAGIDYSEIERRVLSWKTSYQRSASQKRDTLAWLYSGLPSQPHSLPSWMTDLYSAGSTMMQVAVKDGSVSARHVPRSELTPHELPRSETQRHTTAEISAST